ncbi:non-homologous end-joining DNA ligase [Rhodococcus sp. SGAir0479]|uniref:non-homologous end-joining DNA ligase n=1 Tax=Rhodococcus sp. SGAir0479 TaxID=2567884 RepID=UPI0010CCC68B|nr:non-homologous end-joining DNA ligase [Rhodococcus sp. SGAir0479]QCQ90033.1 ATP-dependent DNA ligase [Rhodococcus sp. SGAir0479]
MNPPPAPPSPMLATLGQPPDGDGWAFEMKWDGQRAVADVGVDGVRLFSRNGNDVTGAFPELLEPLAEAVADHEAVLDGEVVALDRHGRPSFARLQRRMHVLRPTTQLRNDFPVTYYAFDVLALDGEQTVHLPYLERRKLLDGLGLSGTRVQVPPFWTGVDGDRMLALAREHHLEGVVAKQVDSTYAPGRRAPAWIKTPLRSNTEGIVVGWVDGTGAASHGVGSLLLGAYDDDGRLVYIGHVGTGFSSATRRSLRQLLKTLERPTSPLAAPPPTRDTKGAHWVEPELVGDVEYREYAGGSLRHPSWKGLRDDKSPDEVDLPGRH